MICMQEGSDIWYLT